MEYCGFCARGRSSENYPRSIHPIRPVTGAFRSGYTADNWMKHYGHWRGNSTVEGYCRWRKACCTWTALSRVRKKGPGRGAEQTRQGNENHGRLRFVEKASGQDFLDELCFVRRGAIDGDSQRKTGNSPRRAKAAAIQTTLVCRTVVCLVAMVPVTGHALRISHRELSWHGPPRLHENHAAVFVSDYSYRSATMGSTFIARRAGRNAASSAIATREMVAPANRETSVGLTP
jgi:hypothetical protein